MLKRLLLPVLIVLTLFLLACPGPKPIQPANQNENPPTDDTAREGESAEPVEPGVTFPFTLNINGEMVGSNMEASVSDGEPAVIDIYSQRIMTGRISVVNPEGQTITLGEWQADQTQFLHSFPYGENHLIIEIDENLYDILVVSGAPERTATRTECTNPFIVVSPTVVSTLRETVPNELPATWTYSVKDISINQQGDTKFTYLMERAAGIEGNVDHTVSLELICRGDVLYITSAVERFDGVEWTTTYDENTIYMPGSLSEGTTWERHGEFVGRSATESISFDLLESFTCMGEERISTEAGEFDAYRMDFTIEKTNEEDTFGSEGVSWYVNGIGRVLTESTIRLELISYVNQ